MAQYKVPQDVEADDKLIGPFSPRQFVYLLIAGALIALGVALFQLFPLLVIIPLPFVLLLLALSLPLKKDQPMETYLTALVSFYLKPNKRIWMPGQSEATIKITAPKKVEESRTRDITGEEATHRLSFLADIVDTGGYSIKGAGYSSMREDLVAEANTITDMFETGRFSVLEDKLAKNENDRHRAMMKEMQDALEQSGGVGLDASAQLEKARRDKEMEKKREKEKAIAMQKDKELRERIERENREAELKEQQEQGAMSEQEVAESVIVMPNSPVITENVEKSNIVHQERGTKVEDPVATENIEKSDVPYQKQESILDDVVVTEDVEKSDDAEQNQELNNKEKTINRSIMELVNNTDFSIATIASEANRIKRKDEDEVFISLH